MLRLFTVEVQRALREEQGPDYHRSWGSLHSGREGGLHEHHQCEWSRNEWLKIYFVRIKKNKKIKVEEPPEYFPHTPKKKIILCVFFCSSWITRRSMKPPNSGGCGPQRGPTFSMPPRTRCSRVTWVWNFSNIAGCNVQYDMFLVPNANLPPVWQYEYKYDKEYLKGCVIPVVDDKLTLLAQNNTQITSEVRAVQPSIQLDYYFYYYYDDDDDFGVYELALTSVASFEFLAT